MVTINISITIQLVYPNKPAAQAMLLSDLSCSLPIVSINVNIQGKCGVTN